MLIYTRLIGNSRVLHLNRNPPSPWPELDPGRGNVGGLVMRGRTGGGEMGWEGWGQCQWRPCLLEYKWCRCACLSRTGVYVRDFLGVMLL